MPVRYQSSTTTTAKAASAINQYRPQYDQQSPMYKHQHSLPMLPVPGLEETFEKYLRTVRPLVTNSEYANTQNLVAEFLKSPQAKQLQQRLSERRESKAQEGKSWFIDWWNDWAYLTYRDPVVINVNYFFQFKDDPWRKKQTQRAAAIVSAAMKFRDQVVSQQLEPDTVGRGKDAKALCMHQYQFMFNASRIPAIPADYVNTFDPKTNQHIAVLRKGRLYTLNLTKKDGQRLSTGEIEASLNEIKRHADQLSWDSHPLPALTTEHRDQWTKARQALWTYSDANKQALNRLDSSVLLVCLDDTEPVTRDEVGRSLWHGDGRNRYFDKSLQFVIYENGKAGFNGEHSMMDATPTSRLCEYVCQKTIDSPKLDTVGSPAPFEPLNFQYPSGFSTLIDNALERFHWDVNRHDHKVLAYEGYGKNVIKNFKVSPDAFVQLSIQLAYYKLFGECRATYESAQTKKFAWGRTEVCRSTNEESVAFVKAALDSSVALSKKMELARKAISSQSKYMADCVEGRGVDRHMLGLRLAVAQGEQMPAVFNDVSYKKSASWYLSTSQISSEYYDGYGWGEVMPEGYGIAYMINSNSVHYNIASLKGGPDYEAGPGSWRGKGKGVEKPCEKMAHYLQESLLQLRQIFESQPAAGNQPKAKL